VKNVVISQPRYLPALNYLRRMRIADEFILLDTVQRQSRGVENRNLIATPEGPRWLTLPIRSSSRAVLSSCEVSGVDWITEHVSKLELNYRTFPFFEKSIILGFYDAISRSLRNSPLFTTAIHSSLMYICDHFGFTPKVRLASDLEGDGSPPSGPEKLVHLCQRVGAGCYISGPNGKNYGVEEAFINSGILLRYHTFDFQSLSTSPGDPIVSFWGPYFALGIEKIRSIINSEPVLNESSIN
jgi:hypothetical protein